MKSLVLGILALLSLSVTSKAQTAPPNPTPSEAATPSSRQMPLSEIRALVHGFKVLFDDAGDVVSLSGKIPNSCVEQFEISNSSKNPEITAGHSLKAGFTIVDRGPGKACVENWNTANPDRCAAVNAQCTDISTLTNATLDLLHGSSGETANATEVVIFSAGKAESFSRQLKYYNQVARAKMAENRATKAKADSIAKHRDIIKRCRKNSGQIDIALASIQALLDLEIYDEDDEEKAKRDLARADWKNLQKEIARVCHSSKMKTSISECTNMSSRITALVSRWEDVIDLSREAFSFAYRSMFKSITKSKAFKDDPESVSEEAEEFLTELGDDLAVDGSEALVQAASNSMARDRFTKTDKDLISELEKSSREVVSVYDPFFQTDMYEARSTLDQRYRAYGCGMMMNTNPSMMTGAQSPFLSSGLSAPSGICQQTVASAQRLESINQQALNRGRGQMMGNNGNGGLFGVGDLTGSSLLSGNPYLTPSASLRQITG